MRFAIRSLAAVCVFASALGVARADTFSGTATFTDNSSSSNNDYNFTGSFDSSPFSFSATNNYVYNDNLTITASTAGCVYSYRGCGNASDDQLAVTVQFSNPSGASGPAGFSGTGDVTWYGFVYGSDIDWSSNSQLVTFSNGSTATVNLANVDGILDWKGQIVDCMSINVDPSSPSPTPEPTSLALLGTGILGLAGAARRKFVL